MNRKTKQLLRENNEFEKNLSAESNTVLTDIVVYLRDCDISEYHQEEVRRDITHMVAEGEARGDSIQTVIAEDYKTFCDDIVRAFPPRSKTEKLFSGLSQGFLFFCIMWTIWGLDHMITALVSKRSIWTLTLTLGHFLDGVLVIAVAVLFVKYVCKTSLSARQKSNRIMTFFVAWVILFALIGGYYLIGHFMTFPLAYLPLPVAAIIAAAAYLLSFFCGNYSAD